MEILTTPYIDEDKVGVQEMSITYVQNPDTNDDRDHYQMLKLTTSDVPTGEHNPEDPPYFINMQILPFDDGTPGHWSIETADELVEIFRDFKERLLKHKIGEGHE